MSADNGYVLRQDDNGKYVLQMYSASAEDYPPLDAPGAMYFDALEEALLRYQDLDPAEYGLAVRIDPTTKEKSSMIVQQAVRKPFAVDAVRITEDNLEEVADWCTGEIQYIDPNRGNVRGNRYIKVRVHNPMTERQTKGFVGNWILFSDKGYKVYTDKAYQSSFDTRDKGEAATQVSNVFEQNTNFVDIGPNHI